MSLDIKCATCGHRNPLGRLYCMSCGAKVDVTEQTITQARDSERTPTLTVVLRGLRLVLTLLLLAALVLMMQPVPAAGRLGNRADANELGRKLTTVQDAVMEGRATSQQLLEHEINAYLVEILRRTPTTQRSWLGADLKAVNLRLADGRVVAVYLVEAGPFKLTQEITVELRRNEDRWSYAVRSLRVGRLSMPAPLGKLLSRRAARVFEGLNREREMLDRVAQLELKTGWVQAATSGR